MSPKAISALLIGLVIITAGIIFSQQQVDPDSPISADAIFVNGNVITINPKLARAEVVAIKQGKIVAVGDQSILQTYKGPETSIIDLQGQTLLPGFIEPHTHPVASAILADLVDLSGFTNPTPETLFDTLQKAVNAASPGEWVLAFGLDALLTEGLIPPTKKQLDKIAPNNPIFILSQVMHTAYVNSLALKKSNLTAADPDPVGGHFERDADGELTGIVHEAAIAAIKHKGNPGWIDKIMQALSAREALIDEYQNYADAGYTTIGVPGPVPMFEGYLQLLEHVASRSKSPLRSFVYPMEGEIEKTDYYPGYKNGLYTVIGVKIYLDGSPWTGAMATAEPYLENDFTTNILKMKPDNRGILKQSPEQMRQKVDKYHNAGWQIAVHAHGERSHDLALDTFEEVISKSGPQDRRHRLEHLGLVTYGSLARAAKLGITPSFFIDHIYYFGPAIRDRLLGAERAERFMPLAWANELHERVSIHTDNPATPLKPMRALRTAVTRIPRFSDQPLNTSQLMSIDNALEAITIDAAWQMHAEDQIGSIEVGKQADFTVLSADPYKVAPAQWNSIKPTATWLGGKQTSGTVAPYLD